MNLIAVAKIMLLLPHYIFIAATAAAAAVVAILRLAKNMAGPIISHHSTSFTHARLYNQAEEKAK